MAINNQELLERLRLCARCRQCRTVSERPLPETLLPICPSGDYYKFDSHYATGRVTIAKKVLAEKINFDDSILNLIYSCSLCGGCRPQCPIDEVDPMEATTILRQLATAEGLSDSHFNHPNEEPLKVSSQGNEILSEAALFVGCESQSNSDEVDLIIKLLQQSGTSFQILNDSCCGGYILRKGDLQGFEERAALNVQLFKKKGIKKIIAHDPLCYSTLKKHYKLEEQGIEVLFYLEFIQNVFKERKINPSKTQIGKVTYHDSCNLGRHSGIYDLPREMISRIPNTEMVEMKRTRENALCCGGVKDWAGKCNEASLKVSEERIKEAEKTGAETIITTCHNCTVSLEKATAKLSSDIKVKNFTGILCDLIAE